VIYTESISIHFLAQSRQNGADIHWWRRATSASCQAAAILAGTYDGLARNRSGCQDRIPWVLGLAFTRFL